MLQIAERARKYKQEALTNLQEFINEEHLKRCFQNLNKYSSPGVDGEVWHDYSLQIMSGVLEELLTKFKSGRYRAPLIRRVYIPKGNSKTEKRPLGIPTIEDKLLQEAVRSVITPIYEEDFKSFSYGFREGFSAHQAIEHLNKEVTFNGLYHIIDADITNYFGSIDHCQLRSFLDRRVKDGVIRKMIDKWLTAGILEQGEISYPHEGTPQGGVISPLLSNIYLHYVLDEWFIEIIQPQLTGKSCIIRYADDFVICFEEKADAERVMKVLPKRFGKYNLKLHAEKTKIVTLTSPRGEGERSFDFLGYTHYLGKSQKGKKVLMRKTSKKKLTLAISKFKIWIQKNNHKKLKEIIREINTKLRGHYNYYGVTFNSRGINRYYEQVKSILRKWLNRRGGKPKWNWEKFNKLVNNWNPLLKPKIYHSYKAKPV
jgi:RNA-directed DNA polymerase